MKKILLMLVLVALVAGVVQNADAVNTRRVGTQVMTWMKADGAGSTTYDSTSVHQLFVSATNGADPDTTNPLDLSQIVLPVRITASDSLSLIGAHLIRTRSDGTASTSADTSWVETQYSSTGDSWSSLRITAVVGPANANVLVDSYRFTNLVAAMNGPIRFLRWIVTNIDKSGDAGTTAATLGLRVNWIRGD